MNLFKSLFGKKLDGVALARSPKVEEFALIELLTHFKDGALIHPPLTQQRWTRVIGEEYTEQLGKFVEAGWLSEAKQQDGAPAYSVTEAALPYIALYEERIARERAEVMPKVRQALAERDTGAALDLRRQYEARQPLGEAIWSGPEPQLSHSALTRRVLFLDHWLLDGLSTETAEWLKLYAAEQHMWGTYWHLPATEIPAAVIEELATESTPGAEMAYWRAYQLALYVDNQETWQRCNGGDHVRRIRLVGHESGGSCSHCNDVLGQEFLVKRVPELPHKECTSDRGCLCRYEPVLESYEQDER